MAVCSKQAHLIRGWAPISLTNTNVDGAERSILLLMSKDVLAAPHILITENQPAIQDLLRWILHLAGYRTTMCADRQALLTWREQALPSEDPVILLLDLSLLCATEAADFLCHLRAKWLDASDVLPQIIVLTTSTQMRAELGTSEHILQKPFHVQDILALIRQVLPVAPPSEESSSLEAHAPCLWRERLPSPEDDST